jgi:hypothetical protein
VFEIGEDDGWEEGREDFQAGLVLLAPLSIRTMDPSAVSRFTGVPEPLVKEFARRLIGNGIRLPKGNLVLSGDDNLAFMMDVWIATGMLEHKVEPASEPAQAGEDAGRDAVGGQAGNPQERPYEPIAAS